MTNLIVRFSILTILFSGFLACSDDNIAPEITKSNLVNIRTLVDVENDGNASDLRMIFEVKIAASITEIRYFIVRAEKYSTLTIADIASLDEDEVEILSLSRFIFDVAPDASLQDTDGNLIVEARNYIMGFAVVVNDSLVFDRNNRSFVLKDEHYLDGKYIGTWNDNLYTDFGISADLTFSNNKLSGPFYYTGGFISCCGGQTDGSLTIELDSSSIPVFRYDQTLANFMGGQCDGLYAGDGQVIDYSVLQIAFEGTDCEGLHTGGAIRLVK